MSVYFTLPEYGRYDFHHIHMQRAPSWHHDERRSSNGEVQDADYWARADFRTALRFQIIGEVNKAIRAPLKRNLLAHSVATELRRLDEAAEITKRNSSSQSVSSVKSVEEKD